jgi:enoyl-CoA hydratase
MVAFLFEKREQIAYLTFNRPEAHNAMSPEVIVRMAEAWREIDRDDTIRAAIITGAGGKAFSAGADLGRLIPLLTGARKPEDQWDRRVADDPTLARTALLRDFSLSKPVIAAVNGFCIAGGMELLQATDLRVASETASFGLQEVKWALVPAGGSLVRLQRQIPYCKTMEILLTGDRIDANEAYRLGLINYVVAPGHVMSKAEQLARTIAENGPLAVRAIKRAVELCSGRPLEEAFKIEDEIGREVFSSEDAREGPRAFMEKRKPRYRGR